LAFSRWRLAKAKEKFEMKQIRATFIIRLIRVIRGQGKGKVWQFSVSSQQPTKQPTANSQQPTVFFLIATI
jgi:hypothetical protein